MTGPSTWDILKTDGLNPLLPCPSPHACHRALPVGIPGAWTSTATVSVGRPVCPDRRSIARKCLLSHLSRPTCASPETLAASWLTLQRRAVKLASAAFLSGSLGPGFCCPHTDWSLPLVPRPHRAACRIDIDLFGPGRAGRRPHPCVNRFLTRPTSK